MDKQTLLVFITLVASALVLFANAMTLRSPMLGAIGAVAFFTVDSWVVGKLLFSGENGTFRMALGLIIVLVILILVGDVFVAFASFTETVSYVTIVLLNVGLGAAFVLSRRHKIQQTSTESPTHPGKKMTMESILFVLSFLLSTIVAFLLLWQGRTGEGGASVWLTIPSSSVPVFLFSSFSLMLVLVFTRLGNALKLGLVGIYSFLAHSLFLLVWYPGRFGDPWLHLGAARYIAETGMPYAYSWQVQQLLIADLALNAQEALTAFLSRMFFVDVYWIHILLVPLLWSILVPIIAYKIAEVLSGSKSKIFPIIAAVATLAFTSLVSWGSISVPNSLSFVLFFASVLFLLSWISKGGRQLWAASLLTVVASFVAHPMAGVFGFTLLLWGTVIRKTERKILWVVTYLGLFMAYPLVLLSDKSHFSLSGLLVVENFMSFQTEISTILLVVGIVGLIYGVRSHLINTKSSLMLFIFYLTMLSEYYLSEFGMTNLPYSAGRIMTMADLLLVPFVGMGFLTVARAFDKGSSLKPKIGASLNDPVKRLRIDRSRRFAGLFLICLFVSVEITVAVYQAYPHSEIVTVQPADYELQAIQFMDSFSTERYVVLDHPTFAYLAIGFLGTDYGWGGNPHGAFGIPSFDYFNAQMYVEMTKTPSIGILEQAMKRADAKLAFFVVSIRDSHFDDVVSRTMEILPTYRTFGDGKLYVFWYPLPIIQEPGPTVRVVFDDGGEQNAPTTFSYMAESAINSTLTISGHSSYNVTDFPKFWTFLDLTVNSIPREFDASSDVNDFIYVKGLQPSDTLTIKWLFNSRYLNVAWKEDSFKNLDKWHTHEQYKGTILPSIASDGNVLTMSYSFQPNTYQYYYYVTPLNFSTNDYPYLLMRWRSNQPVAVAILYFEDGSGQEIVPFGGLSPEWSTIVVPLQSSATMHSMMVGLSNVKNQQLSGAATFEVDFILLASKT